MTVFAGLTLDRADGWVDVTDDSGEEAPPTLAFGDAGVGALQFSIAEYESGAEPLVSASDLREMLEAFGTNNDLGDATNVRERREPPLVSGDFPSDDTFLRAWYLSDGRNVAFVTYVCNVPADAALADELASADTLVRSIHF
jgi:hypothetical protein